MSKFRSWKHYVLAGITVALAASTMRADLVANPSFEEGACIAGGPGFESTYLQVDSPNSGSLSNWVVADGGIDIVTGGNWPAFDGGRSLDMNGVSAGRIYQDISGLQVGHTYEVSFYLAGNPYTGVDVAGTADVIKNIDVSIGATLRHFSFDVTPYHTTYVPLVFPVPNMGWVRKSFQYVADATTARLTFQSTDPPDSTRGPAIDLVAVTEIVQDSDSDGVPDDIDVCPFTAPSLPVDCDGRPLRDANLDCRVDGADIQLIVDELLGQ